MRHFITLSILSLALFTAGCNTIGGFGQDISETGKALDKAAYWSQTQIQDISEDTPTASTTGTDYNNSPIVVQEPDTLRQY